MKISLVIDGEKKEFVQSFVPGRLFRKTLELQKQIRTDITEDVVDEMIEYIVIAFGGQFTFDQCYDGIDARKILDEVINLCNVIIHGGSDSIGTEDADPNA
ncbi:hypothetical protein EJP82_01250 [Paenibacillus anaericanus]|uniref:Uncharacterized protein n=1 Tax=Paenibacillus anaericanus TaxID=170367 RepID=A0A433YFG0_9BACL|nr:hypothetical protein [Paenibacillus anaericanus]RUT48597.1 hypothetical protein EJP82_01250 [Paenibacillus anaericanus]